MMSERFDPLPSDLREARRYLARGSDEDLSAFAQRQIRARQRVYQLLEFYGRCPCHLSRVHLLTSSSVAIARFCGVSASFNALGDAIMPVDHDGVIRTPAWQTYQRACQDGRPWAVRDELWIEAHVQDWQTLREARLDEAFFMEAELHPGDPNWKLLKRHLEITLGARQFDHWAAEGHAPYETAIAKSIGLAAWRIVTRGWRLMRRYAWEMMRGLLVGPGRAERPIVGYRRCAWTLLCSALTAWSALRVYRRGVRVGKRGRFSIEGNWPLLQEVMGEEISLVHPLIVSFYANPGRFDARASLQVNTIPLMFYSRLSALLLGQGLYESDQQEIDCRLRVFRRDDGSMHFVRELYCGDALRVFDSDFVLREVFGQKTLVEVFSDINIDVVLDVEPRSDQRVAVVGRDIFWRGIRLPRIGLKIEFVSKVFDDEGGRQRIEVVGSLRMLPRTAVGRFFMYKVLRRPKDLGSIRYMLTDQRDGPP